MRWEVASGVGYGAIGGATSALATPYIGPAVVGNDGAASPSQNAVRRASATRFSLKHLLGRWSRRWMTIFCRRGLPQRRRCCGRMLARGIAVLYRGAVERRSKRRVGAISTRPRQHADSETLTVASIVSARAVGRERGNRAAKRPLRACCANCKSASNINNIADEMYLKAISFERAPYLMRTEFEHSRGLFNCMRFRRLTFR